MYRLGAIDYIVDEEVKYVEFINTRREEERELTHTHSRARIDM